MNDNKKERVILWAVDPFTTDSKIQRSAAWAIKALTKKSPAVVKPVYLFTGRITALSTPFQFPVDYDARLRADAQEEMSKIVARIRIPGLKPLQILMEPFLQSRVGADILVDFAKEVGAEFIVASTHARKGIKRLVAGSFVETLMLRSDVPLVTVNPTWDRKSDLSHIIFPTDFSSESREAFDKVLDFAKRSASRVTLLHKIVFYPYPDIDLAFRVYPYYLELAEELTAANRVKAAEWVRDAKAMGVQASFVIDDKLTGSPADSVLQFVKRKPGIIALASHSGPLATLFMGSTARQIVRASTHPVWVIHPKARTVAQEQKVIPLRRRSKTFELTDEEIIEDRVRNRRKA